ncbi:uncharacterized protein LOC105845287 isoform X1 [Hydra vulgaris]|uniref:uncharacterized protein LOC105845287 isoform X1 n=1 Tax=Hydra vulgaris TaxID=6087 RepID=UPI001F5F9B22|nr:uncharacterized protein LOC105845287 [Hydra vulgaris]
MLTVLLIFIQILSCAGIIQINNVVTDNAYTLKPLKVTASPGTVVGVISASGDGSGIINYFITDVFYYPPGSQSYDSGTGGTSSWLLYATSSTYDDCSINVLNNYSTRRKCFCIDHKTGEIKTTMYFNQIDQNVGGQYKITLQISQGVVTSKNLLPVVIKLYSICDSIPNLYKLITSVCDSYSYKTDLITSNQYVSLNFSSTLYVSAIQYSLKAGNSIDKGTNISVNIFQSLLVRNFYFFYLNATQIVPVVPPLKLKTKDTFLLQTIIKSSIDIKTFDMRLITIQEMDFCSSNLACINATNEYIKYQNNYSQECPSIDLYGFIAKYGYCNDNKAPIVKNQSAFLDFDLMETNYAPIPVISNFVYDPEIKFLQYSILSVKPKYGLLPVSGNTVSNNMNCDSINMQYPLFCFNSSSNTLFTTNSLLGKVSPDEVFTISIQVSDLEIFPPRFVFFDMVVSCKSLCTKLTTIYRNIFQFCNKEIYLATISNSIISLSNTYQFDAVYYITSIKVLININCDYMEFLISMFQYNNTATARYFCVGSYALLDSPLIVRSGQLYSITAKVFKQNVLQNIITNFSSISFLLIKRDDYCTNSLNCINYVNMYNESFYENPDIKSTCAEVDVYGMTAKYGYCEDNVGPTVIQTNFYIDLNDDYIFTEVIPGNNSMYIFNKNPVEFSINAIEAFSVLSNNVVFPSNCSMTFGDFCINSTTGKIYTSSGIFGKLYSNTSIFFYVRVVDISVYPMRSPTVPLQLLITDRCYRSTASYQYVVTNCVNYTSITSVRVNETKKFIFLLYPLERIISLEIDSSHILNVFEYVSFNATFYNDSEEIYSFTSSKLQVKPTLSIPLNVWYGIVTEIHVTIFGHKFDQINIFSQILEPKLKYLSGYNCTTTCLTKYSEWLSISQHSCNSDLDYLHINFDVCFDPDTMFLSKPTLDSNIVTFGGNVLINNMIYLSPFEFVKSYWLKDGITVLQPLPNDQKKLQITQRSLKHNYLLHGFTAGGLLIKNIGISNQGFYQCVIENNGKSFYSEKVKVILSDIASAKANISISGTIWKNQYALNTSNEYKELLNKFLNQLQNGFSSAFFTKGLQYQGVQFYNRNNYVGALINLFYQIQGGDRIENCRQISEVKFGSNFPVNFIKPCDCCTEDVVGLQTFTGEYTFPITLADNTSLLPCVYNSSIIIKRKCSSVSSLDIPKWNEIDLSVCPPNSPTSLLLIKLKDTNITNENVEQVAYNLNQVIKNGSLTNIYDIDLIKQVIDNIISVNASSEVVTNAILSTVDSLLSSNNALIVKANQKFDSSSAFLFQLDALAKQQVNNLTISKKSIGFSSYIIEENYNPIYIYSVNNKDSLQVNITSQNLTSILQNFTANIILPAQLFFGKNNSRVYSFAFLKNTFFTQGVDSVILSASINGLNVTYSKEPIPMTFSSNSNNSGTRVCGFYKTQEKVWSTEGCNTTSNSSSIISCQCNHLTNFALILDVDQSGNNPLSLQIITWIGCGISIAGLFITIISYSTFRKLRMNLAPKILINLCVSLMVTLIIFLALVEQTKPRVLCQAVASILQFFILSTFFWMAVEGINLYRMFVKVFRGSYSSRIFMLKSSAFAWGIPLIFTIATAAIKPDYLGPATKSDPQICVVRGISFYFGVLLPVCVVIMGNFFILILVLRGVTAKAKLSNNTKVKTQKGYSKIRIALACSVLLGTTWIFAILAVGNFRDAFQWLFCIFNSLQGFFIFFFYTARNSDVKHQWLKFFGVEKSFRDPSSSSASRTMEKTQKIHLASTINRSSTEKISEKESSVEKALNPE